MTAQQFRRHKHPVLWQLEVKAAHACGFLPFVQVSAQVFYVQATHPSIPGRIHLSAYNGTHEMYAGHPTRWSRDTDIPPGQHSGPKHNVCLQSSVHSIILTPGTQLPPSTHVAHEVHAAPT